MKTLISSEKYNRISTHICSNWPEWLIGLMGRVRIAWKKVRMPEKKCSFGELNADKTFYVIRLYPPATGLLANYIYVLGYMEYADRHGWIPVVDMENYETMYSTDCLINGTKNVWEQYFRQPETEGKRYSLEEVYHSKNVILSNGTMDEMYGGGFNEDVIKWQIKQCKRIGFSEEVEKLLNDIYDKVAIKEEKVVGTVIKGGFWERYYHHAIPVRVEQIELKLKEVQEEWEYDCIFVKAQENAVIERLRKQFPRVICIEDKRFDDFSTINDKNLVDELIDKKDDGGKSVWKSQVAYLANIYILSKCNSLIAGNDNGVKTALLWNENKYEHFLIIDNGNWEGKAYNNSKGGY